MAERREFDLAIVGNGAVANAIALRFAERHKDARVAIIGPASRPGCASLAAGAMLNVFAELGAGALDYPAARAKFDAAVAASKLWEQHLSLLNGRIENVDPVRIRQGTYVVTDREDDPTFDAIVGYLDEYKERFRHVDPREIDGLAPRAPVRRAILLEDEGAVSSEHLHRAYDEALSRAGNVSVLDATVESLDAGDAVRTLTMTSGLAIRSKHVVIAAGTRTQAFVQQLRLEAKIPRLVCGVGVALVLGSAIVPKHVVRTPGRGLACGIYVVPYPENQCYVGATNVVRPSEITPATEHAAASLVQAAAELVNVDLVEAAVKKTIIGYRPTTMDTYPLFGRTSIEGVWIASGTKRDGFHMSPKIAEEMVRALDSGEQPFGGRFKPERSLILEVKKAVASERAVAQILASGAGAAEDDVRRGVEDAYARAGLTDHDYGIPGELLEMYREGHAQANVEALLASR